MISRRGLFGILGAALASATLDPERLLWKPGKLISIPPVVGHRKEFLTVDIITRKTLEMLSNSMRIEREFLAHQSWSHIGDTVNIRKSALFCR